MLIKIRGGGLWVCSFFVNPEIHIYNLTNRKKIKYGKHFKKLYSQELYVILVVERERGGAFRFSMHPNFLMEKKSEWKNTITNGALPLKTSELTLLASRN